MLSECGPLSGTEPNIVAIYVNLPYHGEAIQGTARSKIDVHSSEGVLHGGAMRGDIVEKLNHELEQPMRSDRQVVYFLVEARKLLEQQKDA